MELKLVIFLGLVFLVLLLNTVAMGYAWRQLNRVAENLSRHESRIAETLVGLEGGLRRLEAFSDEATRWSSAALRRTESLGEELDKADDWLRYGLAKADFNVERASWRLDGATQSIGDAVSEPLSRVATAIQGIQAVLELVTHFVETSSRRMPERPAAHRESARARWEKRTATDP